ncbi:unnamed protein product [Heligmosomoides polygyrus]|uniref:Extracellular metalloproteinase n=1 Tax=Heligmosomoides polygyrus TaxID=6339 RepID=A0A183G9Q3_HELPZ|nr:unnamed protein product [Heligmosomoides polygyrus]
MIRLLLATALFTLGVSEPSTRIRTGLRRDLPSHLRAATVNAIPPSAAATSVAQGTSFVYSYLNSHLDAKDTSYTENLALTVTNPNQQNAQVTVDHFPL